MGLPNPDTVWSDEDDEGVEEEVLNEKGAEGEENEDEEAEEDDDGDALYFAVCEGNDYLSSRIDEQFE